MSDTLARVRADCLRDYFRQGATVSAAVVAVTGLVAWRLWDHVPHAQVAAWYGAIVTLQLARVVLGRAFRRAAPAAGRIGTWSWGAALLSGALALVLGAGGAWLSGSALLEDRIFMMFVLAAFSAGSVTLNAFNPPAMYAFLLLSSPPYMVYLIGTGDTLLATTGAAATLFVLYLLIVGSQQVRTLHESVRLRHENLGLIAQLQAHGQALTEAGREKARFFAAASHDLRQPVHALSLYASMLQQQPMDTPARDLVQRVGACVESLEGLFGAILAVARAETPVQPVHAVAFALQRVIDAVLVQHAPLAEAKGLRLRARASTAWTRGDPAVLERIVGNLVSNAVRHTDRGGVLVAVRRRADALLLQVIDTGKGIAPEHQKRVFDDFFQVDNPQRDRREGLGLGLGIVRRLCDGLGHELRLASVPGRGSTFSVRLPLAAAQVDEAPTPDPAPDAAPAEHGSVLAVDDDPEIREAMARSFAAWGVDAVTCASAEEALDAVATAPDRWRRFVLDVRLDGRMDGLQLAQSLAARGVAPTRILLVTGETEDRALDDARQLGFTVMHKPVRMLRLRAFVSAPAGETPA